MTPGSTPVAFFIFNRPDLTERSLAAISKARPRRLYVVADGPRASHPRDLELTQAARAVIGRVDWPCRIETDFSDHNLGCKSRLASGLDWVFSQEDRAIIVEDDCVADPSFFAFCEELLERYEGEPRIQMISGCNVHPEPPVTGASYYFSRCYHIWGWATWARAWRTYDLHMSDWPERRRSGWPAELTREPRATALARDLFDLSHSGTLDQWDFQWVYAGWKRDALSVTPSVNLVQNLGYGPQGTHERNPDAHVARLGLSAMKFPLIHPPEITTIDSLDAAEWRLAYPEWFQGSVFQWRRLRRRSTLRLRRQANETRA